MASATTSSHDMDLIAFDGRRFQVLSLPPTPIMPQPLVTFVAIDPW